MNIVVDTNVLTQSITTHSPYYKLYEALLYKKHYLIISNEILSEYYEIFELLYNEAVLSDITQFFNESQIIIYTNPHYRFNLIHADPDDNKFVDAAICGNADFIVTSDKHFNILKEIEFPKVEVISPQDFIAKYC